MELRLDTPIQEDLGAKPYRFIEGDAGTGLLILCDHAENTLPPAYGTLGLKPQDLHRHIAYDLGAAEIAAKVEANDLPNGRLVLAESAPPDFVLRT